MTVSRGRILGSTAAVAVVIAIAAGIAFVATSRRLDSSERRAARLAEEADVARAEAARSEADLEEAENRLDRLGDVRQSVRLLEARAERFAEAACFADHYGRVEDVRGPIRGDVDGDSAPDAVYTVGLPAPRGRCSYHVAVDLGQGAVVTAPVQTARHATEVDELRVQLRPALLVELNGLPGHEVVVVTSYGATGASHQLFTFVDGRLQAMARPDEPFGWSFGASASAGGGTGLDCAGPAKIVIGRYGYSVGSAKHSVERRFYRVAGATLVLEDVETYDRPYGRETRGFPEFAHGLPFPNCADRIPRYRRPH